jgi:hypothetical protein
LDDGLSALTACAAARRLATLAANAAIVVPNRHDGAGISGTAGNSKRYGREKKSKKTHGSPCG